MLRNRYFLLSRAERNAFWTVLITGIFFTLFAGTVFDTLVNAPNLQYRFVNAVPFGAAFIALLSAFIMLAGYTATGAWLFQIGIMILVTINVTQAQGFGFSSALVSLVISLYVPTQVLQGRNSIIKIRNSVIAFWLGVIGAVAILLLDAFWSGSRVPALAQDTTTATILSIVLSLFLIVTTIAQFNSYAFRTKLIVAFALVALIPLVVLGYYNNVVTRSILTEESRSKLSGLAEQAATRIDTYLSIQLEEIRVQALQPTLIRYLKLSSLERAGSPEEADALDTLQALAQKDRGVFIRSIALLDPRGKNLLDTASINIGRDESNFEYFTQPLETKNPFLSNIIFLRSGEGNIYFSAPVEDEFGRTVGILRAEYSSGVVQNQLKSDIADNILAVIDSQTYLRIAYTNKTDILYKTFKDFNDDELSALQLSGRLPQGTRDIIYIPANAFVSGLQNIQNEPYFTAQFPFINNEEAVVTGRLLTNEPWFIIASQAQSTLLRPIQEQSRAGIIISLAILAAAAVAALLAAQIITRPIAQLNTTAEKISQGDLTARANITTQDEIGTLSNTFNRMTSQLQDTLNGLERRVAERSADLEMARLISERRAQELHAISEISRTISTEQKLEILLPLVTRLVSERFTFYHVGIFFIDKTGQYAVLQAANSEGGKQMVERGHQLEVGQTGIVGNVAHTGKPRIALDVGSDAVFFNNPYLPETRSEMALPLNVRGQTIGVMDVQSTKPGAFSESDANTLSILADQVAIAIENARLFGQTQEALDEVQKLYRQFQTQEWNEFIRQSSLIGYRQGIIEGKPLTSPVENDEIKKALQNGEVVVLDNSQTGLQPILAIPVKLRGQTIGVLHLKAPKKKTKWSREELNLAQAISDRLALALENARLIQESQRRAAKEQKIGEMTAKIGASINMRNVLQTAVEELGRALPGSEVIIQFQPSQEN